MASTRSQESILQLQETPALSYTSPSSSSLYPHPRIPLSGSEIMPVSSLPLSARSTSTTTEQTAVNVNYNDEGRRTPSGASTTVISHCGDDDENLAKLEKINDGHAAPRHRQGDGEFSTSRDQQIGGMIMPSSSAILTEDQRRLAIMYRNAADKRSAVPIFYFLAASLGKLILGLGVSLAIKGHYGHSKSGFAVGIVLASLGFIAVVAAALGFGAAASRINKRMGIIFKCFSIGGGIFISIGYALKQYFVSDHKPMFSIRLSFIPLALGTAMMGISLPNFTAYTELYRGQIVGLPVRHRPIAALLCLSPSMGILFGGWISAEVAEWPVAFNSAVLTFAVALGYGGVALFWSNNLRVKAQMYELMLCREEENLQRQQVTPSSPSSDGTRHPLPSQHQDEKVL